MATLTPIPNPACCRGKCKEWKNMLNFLHRVPKFWLADCCKTCLIWYPKNLVVKCPCCHQRVRSTPNHRSKNYLTESEIRQIIIDARARGWTLLKHDNIVKSILDFESITYSYKRLK